MVPSSLGVDPDGWRSWCWAVLWLTTARKSLDDDHAATAAGTWPRQHTRLIRHGGGFRFGLGYAGGHGEQFAGAGHVCGAVAVGEQAVVTDTMHALGQHVDEEAADELAGCERHHFVTIRAFDTIVLVAEADAACVRPD